MAVRTINAKLEHDYHLDYISEEFVKQELSEKITKEIMKAIDDRIVHLVKRYEPNHNTHILSADFQILPLEPTISMSNDTFFVYKDKYFSKKKIEEALMETFPEEFL